MLANAKPEVKEVTKRKLKLPVRVPSSSRLAAPVWTTMARLTSNWLADSKNPDKKYKVAGYANKATGSFWNQKLSEKRAQVVYDDALIAQGVDKDHF